MRETIDYLPSSIHMLDPQGDALARYIRFKHLMIGAEELLAIQNFVCPDWLIHVLDAECANPEGFVFDLYDRRCLFDGGRDITGLCVGELGVPGYNDGNLERYELVKRFGRPCLTHETLLANPERSYYRYISPMISEGGVQKMLIASRYQKIGGLGTETPQALSEALLAYG